MQMEKRQEAAFVIYFILLIVLVFTSMQLELNVVNLVYLIVVLCGSLRFILIMNKNKR